MAGNPRIHFCHSTTNHCTDQMSTEEADRDREADAQRMEADREADAQRREANRVRKAASRAKRSQEEADRDREAKYLEQHFSAA